MTFKSAAKSFGSGLATAATTTLTVVHNSSINTEIYEIEAELEQLRTRVAELEARKADLETRKIS